MELGDDEDVHFPLDSNTNEYGTHYLEFSYIHSCNCYVKMTYDNGYKVFLPGFKGNYFGPIPNKIFLWQKPRDITREEFVSLEAELGKPTPLPPGWMVITDIDCFIGPDKVRLPAKYKIYILSPYEEEGEIEHLTDPPVYTHSKMKPWAYGLIMVFIIVIILAVIYVSYAKNHLFLKHIGIR